MNTYIKLTFRERPIEIDVEYKVADHGIGTYEFWGAIGHDSQIGVDEYWLNCGTWEDSDKNLTEQELIDVAEEHEDEILQACEKHFENVRFDD